MEDLIINIEGIERDLKRMTESKDNKEPTAKEQGFNYFTKTKYKFSELDEMMLEEKRKTEGRKIVFKENKTYSLNIKDTETKNEFTAKLKQDEIEFKVKGDNNKGWSISLSTNEDKAKKINSWLKRHHPEEMKNN